MAGVFTSRGMEILSAGTSTLADELLFLRYIVQDADYAGEPPADRIEEISQALVQAIDSEAPPRFRSVWGREAAEAEKKAKELNKSLKDMTLAEMDIFWEEAKTK